MPIFNQDAIGACDAVRTEATAIAGANAAYNLGRATGALDFITTPGNDNGVEVHTVGDPSQTVMRTRILYDQRTRPCQVSTDPSTNICNDTGTTTTRKQAFVDIDKKISSPARYFTVEEMAVLCGEKTDGNDASKQHKFIKDRLTNDLRASRERLDEIILAEMNARVGKNYHFDGSTTAAGSYKSLQLLDNNNTQQPDQALPLQGNFVKMIMDYQNMQFSGTPAIIGQGNFDWFMRLQKLACCNSATPYEDAVAAAGVAYYFDQAANAVLGTTAIPHQATKVIMVPFGVLHLLTYNINNAIKFATPQEAHTVVSDPVNPRIKWNLDFKWDCTTNRWKYMYSLHWTLFNVFQTDSFSTDTGTPDCGDELHGVNGVWGYNITQG
jgi:hypothetical protein